MKRKGCAWVLWCGAWVGACVSVACGAAPAGDSVQLAHKPPPQPASSVASVGQTSTGPVASAPGQPAAAPTVSALANQAEAAPGALSETELAPLPEPLPPLTRLPETVPLPGIVSPILSVSGRGPKDVWLLTADQVLLQHDGARILRRYARPCGWGDSPEGGVGTRFFSVFSDGEQVMVLGESRDPWSRLGEDLTATLSKAGRWSCKSHGVAPTFAMAQGEHLWKLSHNLVVTNCRLHSTRGNCATTPDFAASFHEPMGDAVDSGVGIRAMWMNGADDGFMVAWDPASQYVLFRYNGVAWSPVAPIEQGYSVLDLWADAEGNAWLLTRVMGDWSGPGTGLLRYDGKVLKSVAIPASFAARMVRGTGPRDVWLSGDEGKLYQWDGELLRQGSLPREVSDMWASPDGDLWLVGPGPVQRVPGPAKNRQAP